MAAAVWPGCLVYGLVMPGPIWIREVAAAMAAITTYTSRVASPSSYTQTRSKPSSSAWTARSTISPIGPSGITLMLVLIEVIVA